MNTKLMNAGQRVLANPTESRGLTANAQYMRNRKGENRPGVILKPFDPVTVPEGHAAAWVTHEDGTVAPYWFHELEARR